MTNIIAIQEIIVSMSQQQNIKTVIVTGAAGYIGGSICIELKKLGYRVVGVDRRHRKHLDVYYDKFIHDDFVSTWSLMEIEHNPIAVIHCAGTSLVGPSMLNPVEYYENNVVKTFKYLDYIRRWSPNTKFIFSSSASVYGSPPTGVCLEIDQTNPISPYGQSKLMTEMMLESFSKAYDLSYVSFRYFNACGAVEGGAHGQEPDATHIFARLFESAFGRKPFTLYGSLYDTPDGTCIRDYVHVTDIAKAHIIAIENSIKGIYNIGSNRGHSNLEIFNAVENYLIMEERINHEIVMMVENPREGDPAKLIADSTKLQTHTNWKPEKTIDNIIEDLDDWYNSVNYDFIENQED